eukprot:comp21709_c0_seq2/m.30652 comp21709_c0_seq2/g.30652  ORF comp21709_c0_seq2/g.30652 comp21709_c0_seq2/m.30652 type:complete len:216 (-) comp21709_c0_seq2:157-804(-)
MAGLSTIASIEAGLGTDLRQLNELQDQTKDDLANADREIANFLNSTDLSKLGIDLSGLDLDLDAVNALEEKEKKDNGKSAKKFVSPYANPHTETAEPPAANSPPTEEKKKKPAAVDKVFSLFKKDGEVSKKDLKKWQEMHDGAKGEVKVRDGLQRLLDTYIKNPEKGSPEAMRELDYQVGIVTQNARCTTLEARFVQCTLWFCRRIFSFFGTRLS